MAKYVIYTVIKQEEFYLPMMIRSVIDHADMFIVDTGSTDKTIEIIKSFQEKYPGKIVLHEELFGSEDYRDGEFRFARGYRQMDATNFALESARKMCDPDGFVIELDADEVLNDRYWEVISECDAEALCCATEFPVTPFKVSTHPLDMHDRNGIRLFDPHIRAWRANVGCKWMMRNADAYIHLVLQWERQPIVKTVPDNIHFHLHYSFGPKSIYSYMVNTEQVTEQAAKILDMPLQEMHNQAYFEKRWPEWFKDGRFVPLKVEDTVMWNKHGKFTAPIKNPMPDYVCERWLEWGDPIDA